MPLYHRKGQMETVMGGAVNQLLASAASGSRVGTSEIEAQLSALTDMKGEYGKFVDCRS